MAGCASREGPVGAAVSDVEHPPARERLLYVANDATSALDVFDIDDGHRLRRSIAIPGTRFRGVTAHAASARLYYTESSTDSVGALDLRTDQIVWARSYQEEPHACKHPDRLNVTQDGKTLYVPCADNDRVLFVDAQTGQVDGVRSIAKSPHNTFTGESGRYMYVSTHEGGPLYLFDPRTGVLAGEIGPFSSSVRPFTVDEAETHAYANLTALHGFAAIDLASGGIQEIAQETPAERRSHPEASAGRPHAGAPFSHGIALRPGSREILVPGRRVGLSLRVRHTDLSPVAPGGRPALHRPQPPLDAGGLSLGRLRRRGEVLLSVGWFLPPDACRDRLAATCCVAVAESWHETMLLEHRDVQAQSAGIEQNDMVELLGVRDQVNHPLRRIRDLRIHTRTRAVRARGPSVP